MLRRWLLLTYRFRTSSITPPSLTKPTKSRASSTRHMIPNAFASVSSFTVGELRDWLLSDDATSERLAALAPGLAPEMAAAVSKLTRLQDLVLIAR